MLFSIYRDIVILDINFRHILSTKCNDYKFKGQGVLGSLPSPRGVSQFFCVCVFCARLVERKKAAVKRCEEQLLKLEVQATDREENKQIALGTSKLNYLDPRISVAW